MAFRTVITAALLVLALLALALPLTLAQAAVLGAREPLTAELVEELLEDALHAAGAEAPFELVVDEPHLPLLNQSARATCRSDAVGRMHRYPDGFGRIFDALP